MTRITNIGIVGTGKLGCSLAIGLHKEGYHISGLYNCSNERVEYLNQLLNCQLENSLFQTIQHSECIFLSVPDAFISTVVDEILSLNINLSGKLFFHVSGATLSNILSPLKNAVVGSLHPLQTFASYDLGFKGLYNITFGFEGDDEAFEFAKEFVARFNGNLLHLNTEQKVLYHAAASIISNYSVTLSYFASQVLQSVGLEESDALKALLPLLNNTVNNLNKLGSIKALTGPISRGDVDTVRKHISSLETLDNNISVEVYCLLGLKTLEAMEHSGLFENKRNEIEILKKELKNI